MTEVINIMRHESVFNPAKFAYPMHIIGAGATGSRVFAALVELGITNISVYDPDVVEDHNLANQIYVAEDVGQTKVEGCHNFVRRKLGAAPDTMGFVRYHISKTYIEEGGISGGVVFILTDTMESRKEIFDALIARCDKATHTPGRTTRLLSTPLLIIETRMGSTHGTVFSINPFDEKDRKAWYSTLVDDTDEDLIELSPCGTTLSVGTTASLIANYAVWQMMQFFVDPVGMHSQLDLFFKPTLTITSSVIAA